MKQQSGLVYVTMGAYDVAKVCKLVGTYMLSLISEKYYKKDFDRHCDDGLGVVKNKSGPETEKITKNRKSYLKKINQIQLFSAT